uniref:UDP-glycosyltransferases domain-containing protein n=1 Tax=Oryza barthii TaxID=65489 RepID=A0A0D3HCD0_9ORYZ
MAPAPPPPARPHALVIPFPAQGHVIPLMEVAHALADRGVAVTFVNTEFNHGRVVAAMPAPPRNGETAAGGGGKLGMGRNRIRLVAVPDGMGPDEDRNNLLRLTVLMQEHMAPRVEELIRRSGGGRRRRRLGEDHVRGDGLQCRDMGAGRGAAHRREVRCRLAGVGCRHGVYTQRSGTHSGQNNRRSRCIPELVRDKVIDAQDGSALTQEAFQLSPDMPMMQPAHLAWNCIGNDEGQELLFRYLLAGVRAVDECDYILCNSFRGAEAATFARFPKILPVGPLLTGERPGMPVGNFWRPEDGACMSWLDAQPARSVVYVAFGSFTMFDRPAFLVGDIVRGDVHEYPDGFLDRVVASGNGGGRGKLVAWAPQQRVLAHPAVACFVSHCGWNSTMEGVRNGVPFVAWPYFADQFVNRAYICDIWRVGLPAVADEKLGVVTKKHIAGRVEEVMGDSGMRKRIEAMMAVAHESVQEGGCSHGNFDMLPTGSALTQEAFQLSPDMPMMQPAHLAWNCIGNDQGQELLFSCVLAGVRAVDECDYILCNSFRDAEAATFARCVLAGVRAVDECDYILCNSFRDAEAATFARFPQDSSPIGPLPHRRAPRQAGRPLLAPRGRRPARSVVYVAFGSFTVFDRRQFQELALGLELTGRPFLWVVRPDIVHGDVHEYPDGFLDRVVASGNGGGRGKVVAWAPQQRVLAHPAVACFVSHCGWNSIMEGVRNGVPFVAWPYFADQFVNRAYICDIWRVGLPAVADKKSGMVHEGAPRRQSGGGDGRRRHERED